MLERNAGAASGLDLAAASTPFSGITDLAGNPAVDRGTLSLDDAAVAARFCWLRVSLAIAALITMLYTAPLWQSRALPRQSLRGCRFVNAGG